MSHLPDKSVLATDGSEDARRAAADLDVRARAELHVVHAWQSVPHPVIDAEYYEEGARRLLEEETEFVSGTILEEAGEDVGAAILIAVGSRGRVLVYPRVM